MTEVEPNFKVLADKVQKRRRINQRSARRVAANYGDFVRTRLELDMHCEVRMPGCTWLAEGLHHRRKRSAGGRLVSRLNTVRACNACNGRIEDEPDVAHFFGWVVREGDAWWPWLGTRLPSGRLLTHGRPTGADRGDAPPVGVDGT